MHKTEFTIAGAKVKLVRLGIDNTLFTITHPEKRVREAVAEVIHAEIKDGFHYSYHRNHADAAPGAVTFTVSNAVTYMGTPGKNKPVASFNGMQETCGVLEELIPDPKALAARMQRINADKALRDRHGRETHEARVYQKHFKAIAPHFRAVVDVLANHNIELTPEQLREVLDALIGAETQRGSYPSR